MLAAGPADRREQWNHFGIAERRAQPDRIYLLSDDVLFVHLLSGTFAICKPSLSFISGMALLTVVTGHQCSLSPHHYDIVVLLSSGHARAFKSATFRFTNVCFNLTLSVVVTFSLHLSRSSHADW
jgi:hypothetical protein